MIKAKHILIFASLALCILLTACKTKTPKNDPGVVLTPFGIPRNVQLTWTANRETAVNTTGGGYIVYYSATTGFSIPSTYYVTVPYVSGSSAPTTVTIRLNSGTWYFRVAAYSAMNTLSGGSTQTMVRVP